MNLVLETTREGKVRLRLVYGEHHDVVVDVTNATMADAFVAAVDQFRLMQEATIELLERHGLMRMQAAPLVPKDPPS